MAEADDNDRQVCIFQAVVVHHLKTRFGIDVMDDRDEDLTNKRRYVLSCQFKPLQDLADPKRTFDYMEGKAHTLMQTIPLHERITRAGLAGQYDPASGNLIHALTFWIDASVVRDIERMTVPAIKCI